MTQNPWQAIRQEQQARAQRDQEREAAEEARRKTAALWGAAAQRLDVEALLALTKSLRSTDFGLWLDLEDVSFARADWIHEQNLCSGYGRGPGFYYRVAGQRLLKHALLSREQDLQRELDAMHEANGESALRQTLLDMRDGFEAWCDGVYPPTPFLSQTELAEALRGRLKGYGKSGISQKVTSDELRILKRTSAANDGRTFYAEFCHREPTVQREILGHIVNWAREKSPAHCSFLSGVWCCKSVEIGA